VPEKPLVQKEKTITTKSNLKIPPILLEGDEPSPPPATVLATKFALGPARFTPPAPAGEQSEAESLPEAYGTQRVMLIARDAHWIYAFWDFSTEQQYRCNSLSADGHLVLKIYLNSFSGQPISVLQVHPESRHWFIHVERASTHYVGELGYINRAGQWVSLAVSSPVVTPADSPSADRSITFASMPSGQQATFDVGGTGVHDGPAQSWAATADSRTQAESFAQDFWAAHPGGTFETTRLALNFEWSPEQDRALAEFVDLPEIRRRSINSEELLELLPKPPRQPQEHIFSMGAAEFGELPEVSSSMGALLESISSPMGGERPINFWFNINAELTIYGATEPDAKVTIGGRPIRLRPDGTFSYRYALPDGRYELPVVAASLANDVREARLNFSRATDYRGNVGIHPHPVPLEPISK
jgi:hypothetical protein